jgi:hypothetical protein
MRAAGWRRCSACCPRAEIQEAEVLGKAMRFGAMFSVGDPAQAGDQDREHGGSMSLRLDHLAISAGTLDEGVAAVEEALGVPLAGGGQHPHMATHNRLLGLGDLYLEVIAADPAAAARLAALVRP